MHELYQHSGRYITQILNIINSVSDPGFFSWFRIWIRRFGEASVRIKGPNIWRIRDPDLDSPNFNLHLMIYTTVKVCQACQAVSLPKLVELAKQCDPDPWGKSPGYETLFII